MNTRALVLPLAVLLVGGGIGLWFRPRPAAVPPVPAAGTPAGPAVEGGPASAKAPEDYRLEPVREVLAPKTEAVPARIHTPESFSVFPSVPATPVSRILAWEGTTVKKGDCLLEFQEAGWKRELDAAGKAGDAVRAEAARKALASLRVLSPEDGMVFRVDARVGERPLLQKGEPLPIVTLFDWRRIVYEGTAPASLSTFLKEGSLVFVGTGKDKPVAGRVEKTDPPSADGGIHLLVLPTAPPASVPDPEQAAEIRVVVGTRLALTVPRRAIRTVDGHPTVSVVRVTGELVPRPVLLGVALPGNLVEVSGVKLGESVAVWER